MNTGESIKYDLKGNIISNKDNIEYYGEKGYILYNMDGSIYTPYGDGHAMVGIGRTNDGKIIVSSWGEKLILELSTEEDDIKMGQEEYRKFI